MTSPLSALSISDFRSFAKDQANLNASIGKKFFSLGNEDTKTKAATSTTFQSLSGGSRSIVNDFTRALENEYGSEIAKLVFSKTEQDSAIRSGLTRERIQQVFSQADTLAADYKNVISSKVEALQIANKTLTQLTERFPKDVEITKAAKSAESLLILAQNLDKTSPSSLGKTIANLSQKIGELFVTVGKLEKQAVKIKHQLVMKQLLQLAARPSAEIEEVVNTLATTTIDAIEKSADELKVFSTPPETNPASSFCLDDQGGITVSPVSPSSLEVNSTTPEEQRQIWGAFIGALEGCYGKEVTQSILPDEEREGMAISPLTVVQADEIFARANEVIIKAVELLQKEPLIQIQDDDDEELDTKADLDGGIWREVDENVEGETWREVPEQLDALPPETLLVQGARELFDIGVLFAVAHPGTALALAGIASPSLPLILASAALLGALGGIIVARNYNGAVMTDTATVAATYDVGGQIALAIAHAHLGPLSPIAKIIADTVISAAGATATDIGRSLVATYVIPNTSEAIRSSLIDALTTEDKAKDDNQTAHPDHHHYHLVNTESRLLTPLVITPACNFIEAVNRIPMSKESAKYYKQRLGSRI